MPRGYHYTTLANYGKIKIDGLLPVPFVEKDGVLGKSKDKSGIWLFCEPQEDKQLFGILADTFTRHKQKWIMVELEVDFEIKDCIKAIDEENALKITYTASIENWEYYSYEPILVIRAQVPPDKIRLCRVFDLHPSRGEDNESP